QNEPRNEPQNEPQNNSDLPETAGIGTSGNASTQNRWTWPWIWGGFVVPPVAILLFVVLFPALETRSHLDGTEASLQMQATHVAWLEARLEAVGTTEPTLAIDLTDSTSAGTVV